jgi:N-acetylglucosaminyldiphosphoundecaprenol N-acetyl-beta-D-mannosaminyltransferase
MLPTSVTAPARANVLGVGVSAIDMEAALSRCEQLIAQRGKGYVCVTGVHGIIEAQRDPALREILNRSFLCTPDGMPTVWVGRFQGHRQMRRVYGPELMGELCRRSVRHGYRHFLYGGNAGVAALLQRGLERQIPGIQICGSYTPPFRPLTADEADDLAEAIRRARPEIVWVGLSTPKQERFMAAMLPRLDTCLMIGVGAAFDIHAGRLRDAPQWMKSCGLQWLHRLALEPRRLWRRYFTNNPRFIWNIGLQLTGLRSFSLDPAVLDRR